MQKPKSIPKTPGIYIFRNADKTPIYIGKAALLRSRVSSYFSKSGKNPKTEKLMEEAVSIEFLQLMSEAEALIREAELIKKLRPKYNVLMRDDKSYFYVAVTKERFPRIFVTHQPKKIQHSPGRTPTAGQAAFSIQHSKYVGPFTE
ncbi:MAG: GIY-YIG nuclease family protein, partial [Candidatus Sungbacteria bacterium]|nr:GIY-YIG nuclease family protein [Candidatus Sungbacteria bacterium]